ncbi:MAG: glycosyltransferase family 2 protein [Hydrococcus sp. C42_A2020_068]|uniref:glycosyltransferase family 2 protein n=1 Tax=Pleurocapsa sp. PCC 7327 TaxID=118163 RepID=UPI00029FFD33|nr:glycosyltransferase family A protein [Pleurocapsa sp. PCC 7327]AFY79481.1 putative glycosyltransferase [Pleurocapsa sp. PCC 7327]MBF2021054.1 glycosyltransferase family 2 protein [Hydrococcus sp. C42_A2020_068]
MTVNLTIGIITCGRPDRISKCLNSISKYTDLAHSILVVDSKITSENLEIYQGFPNITSITFESPISPAAARAIVAQNVSTPYILFLDDDIQIMQGTVSKMVEYLDKNLEVDIVGGAWLERGKYREIGQFFNLGTVGDRPIIYKSFLSLNEAIKLNLSSVRVDGVQATFLARKKIFDRVQFDPRYGFYFELFDFFLQCKQQNIYLKALPDVIFEHNPTTYRIPTLRQTSDSESDRQKFIDKWGIYPIGSLGGRLVKLSEPQKFRLFHFFK